MTQSSPPNPQSSLHNQSSDAGSVGSGIVESTAPSPGVEIAPTQTPTVRRITNHAVNFWAEYVLTIIILCSVLLALHWVFKVPILQNPDENSHIDYAFSIYSAGRLLNARRPPSEWNVQTRLIEVPEGPAFEFISHQYTLYLIDQTDFMRIRFHPDQKVSANYGSYSYYRDLDQNAPKSPAQLAELQPRDNPWLVNGYPFFYYAVLAVWFRLVSILNGGPAFLFLSARVFSAILLACNLMLSYLILRELRMSKRRALLLTAILAFFPTTTFIASSVQPDNLAWTLMCICFYIALLIRNHSLEYRKLGLLGIALGLLLVTKYHFYLFTLAPVVGLLIADHVFHRRPIKSVPKVALILLSPSLVLGLIQLWVVRGREITGGNIHFATAGYVGLFKKGVADLYRGGPALVSYWGRYGWADTELTIKSPEVERMILILISALTLLVLLLVLFRLEQVITRLVVLAHRGRWRTSLRLIFSNPFVNSNFIFSAFMLALYAIHEGGFNAQGRHWFPYFLSGFLIATEFAPRALTHRKTQSALSSFLLCGLLLYCVVGSYYSIQVIKTRFYPQQAIGQSRR